MRKTIYTLTLLLMMILNFNQEAKAQIDGGLDIYSRYLWRGLELSSSPSFQPWLAYSGDIDSTAGVGFEIGAWGAYSTNGGASADGSEADLYASIGAGNFSLTLTDYFFPSDLANQDYFDYGAGGHAYELMASYSGPLDITAAYDITNEAFYSELGYAFGDLGVFAGLGNEYYSTNTDFDLMNIGLNYSKDIQLTEKFALPISAITMWNPNADKFHIAAGISF